MKKVTITNKTQPVSRIIKANYCQSFFCKLRGLMFYEKLNEDEALLIVEKEDSRLNAAIHMLFMKFDLALIWINSQGIVVDLKLARAWGIAYIPKKPAKYILEAHKNRLVDFHINDKLSIDEN